MSRWTRLRKRVPVAVVAGACLVPFAAFAVPPLPGTVLFRFPVQDPAAIWADWVLHVDHDPRVLGEGDIHCTTSDCTVDFPFCYDEHHGTDFILDGGFDTMDRRDTPVVAAADGTVIAAVDGNYDRCHADLQTQEVTCDGHEMRANYVGLAHADGTVTYYYHLKKGSVAVAKDQQVACGQVLGFVGSSGMSSMPHLHFQVEDGAGNVLDPYAGACAPTDVNRWVVPDAGNGLPGPWCQGQEIPPEPVPEAASEIVPAAVAEPVPEAEPEPTVEPVPDMASDPSPEPFPEVAMDADVLELADAVPQEVSGGDDASRPWHEDGGFGCSAGPGAGAAGSAIVGLVLMLAVLALGRVLRRTADPRSQPARAGHIPGSSRGTRS